jgi:Recombinase zinc beta ribbon domain
VSAEVWDRVQRRLAEHRAAPRAEPERFLLTGLLVCSKCESSMAGETLKRASGSLRRRYRCVGNRRAQNGCNETADAEQVEGLVLDHLGSLLAGFAARSTRTDAMRKDWERRTKPPENRQQQRRIKQLEQRAKEEQEVIRGAGRKFSLDQIDKARYDDLCREANEMLATIEADLAELRQSLAPAVAWPLFDAAVTLVGGWASALLRADAVDQREALTALVERAVAQRVARNDYALMVLRTPLGSRLAELVKDDA